MGQVDYQVARFRRSLWRLLWLRFSVRALVGGFWIAGCLIVAARLLWEIPASQAAWGLAPLSLLAVLGGWLTWRRLPPASVVRAEIDRASRTEGLVMAQAEAELGEWESRLEAKPLQRPRLAWSGRRPLGGLLAACGFAAATLLVPDSWLARAADLSSRFDVEPDVARLEEKIEILEELEVMPEEEAKALKADLKDVEKQAAGDDPAKTLEALDHVEDRLSRIAEEEAAKASKAAQTAAELASAAKSLNEAASRMPAETLNKMMEQLAEMTKKAEKECQAANKDGLEAASDLCENGLTPGDLEALGDCLGNCPPAMQGLLQRLAEGGLIDPNQIPGDCPGLSPEELEALAEALAECELGDADLEDLLEACRLCLGEGDCAGGCLLAGNRPGRGGINRGPGHAKLNFDGETEEHAGEFQNRILAPGGLKRDGQSVLRSVGRSEPGQTEERAVSKGSGLATRGGVGGAHTRVVLPAHRRVVRKYFDRAAE